MKVLVVIDMQNDFVLPEGSLSVQNALNIIPIINSIRSKFDKVLFSFDFHPENHVSFVNNHEGHKVYDIINTGKVDQMLFPAHCVQRTTGCDLHKDITFKDEDLVVRKGLNSEIDSYSCFFDVIKTSQTNADFQLLSIGAKDLYFLGVATDFCVKFSVLDAISLGYNVYVIEDGIYGVIPDQVMQSIDEMKSKGAKFIKSTDI